MPTDSEIVLVATFRGRPDRYDDLRARLLEMVDLTRQEPGCIQYELHEDVGDPLTLTFIETWASAEALATHDMTDHVVAIIRDAPDLLVEPIEVTRLVKLA